MGRFFFSGVTELVGMLSSNWKFAGSVPGEGSYLGKGLIPGLGIYERQLIHAALSHRCFSIILKNNKKMSWGEGWKNWIVSTLDLVWEAHTWRADKGKANDQSQSPDGQRPLNTVAGRNSSPWKWQSTGAHKSRGKCWSGEKACWESNVIQGTLPKTRHLGILTISSWRGLRNGMYRKNSLTPPNPVRALSCERGPPLAVEDSLKILRFKCCFRPEFSYEGSHVTYKLY